jgi:hypothetical protein
MHQLDMWIEGYSDVIDWDADGLEDMPPPDVVVELLRNREMAEVIRGRIWKRTKRRYA